MRVTLSIKDISKSSLVAKGIEDAYKLHLMQHQYPFTVLHLTMDGTLLDVNVHPSKMELRFSDGKGVYEFLYESLKEALEHREFIPEVSVEDQDSLKKITNYHTAKGKSAGTI